MCGSMLHRTGKIWLLQHAILSWWLVVMMMMIHINVMSSPGCHEFSSLFHSNCTLGCDVVLNEPHWTCTPVAKWNWIVTSNQFQLEINCFIKPLLLRVYGMIGMCISGVKLYIRPCFFYYAVSTWEKDNGHVPCPLYNNLLSNDSLRCAKQVAFARFSSCKRLEPAVKQCSKNSYIQR